MCTKVNVPSVSSINRIVRTRAQQRQKHFQEKAALGHFSILQTLQGTPETFIHSNPGVGLLPSHYGHNLPQQPFFTGFSGTSRGSQTFPSAESSCYPGQNHLEHNLPLDPTNKLFAVFPTTSQQSASVPTSSFQPQTYFVYPTVPPISSANSFGASGVIPSITPGSTIAECQVSQ